VILGLAACQGRPRAVVSPEASTSTAVTDASLSSLAKLSHFSISGKLAFKQGERGGNARFHWEQQAGQYTLRLMNPFGGEEARLVYSAKQARLKFPQEDWVSGEDLKQVFEQHLGWVLPFERMAYWIKGMPVPGVPHQFSRTESGYRFIQSTWIIDCEDLVFYQGVWVPGRMLIRHREDDRRLKLVLNWL